jgi:hypothetical protein
MITAQQNHFISTGILGPRAWILLPDTFMVPPFLERCVA